MVDIDDKDFEDELSTFGVSVDDTDVYDKLRQLCQIHRLDAEEIVCEWLAFAQMKTNVRLNADMLDVMERDRLVKKQNKNAKTPKSNKSKVKLYNQTEALNSVVEDVLGAYSTPNSKINNKRQHTPDNPVNKRLTGNGRSTVIPFSPASFSPTQGATPSRKYSNRTNAGQVVCSWGTTDNMSWSNKRDGSVKVDLFDGGNALNLTSKYKYMFQKLSDKASVLNDMIEEMGEFLKIHYKIEEEFSHVSLPMQETTNVIGRVCCDTVGKLNAKSVMLEGSRETSGGSMITLDLSEVPQFSLFPGQVIAAEGINSTGNKFVVKKLYEGACDDLPEEPAELNEGPLSIVVAVGPFTTSDSVMYEPLGDLVKYLHKEVPDVCILMGPFVDSKQADIEEAMTDLTFESFFKEKIVNVLSEATSRLKTQIVFVPSYRDIHHEYVYPQPPFTVEADPKSTLGSGISSKKIQFVSDPCTLNIDGVVVGLTSTDVLFHLGQEETSSSTGGDRLTRLTQHILTQHTYYPLHPAHEDMNIDYDNFDLYTHMPCTPHVFILPSDLRYFIKDINGCCCINPGRVAKGQVGGTYARIVINSSKSNVNKPKTITNQISAQVLRI